jgi:hypothetical protein
MTESPIARTPLVPPEAVVVVVEAAVVVGASAVVEVVVLGGAAAVADVVVVTGALVVVDDEVVDARVVVGSGILVVVASTGSLVVTCADVVPPLGESASAVAVGDVTMVETASLDTELHAAVRTATATSTRTERIPLFFASSDLATSRSYRAGGHSRSSMRIPVPPPRAANPLD